MGQYFQLIETERHEFASPWALGGGAKLWEWCANRQAMVIPYLLVCKELSGKPSQNKMLGRWANGSLALVGDYDEESSLYEGCDTAERALESGRKMELVAAVPNEISVFEAALVVAGIEGGSVRRDRKNPKYAQDDPRRRFVVDIPAEATDEQVLAFLRAVYGAVQYASLTVPALTVGPHGPDWREFRVRGPWGGGGDLVEEVKHVVMNLDLSYQIAREFNKCGAPWTGDLLMTWGDKLADEEMEAKGLSQGRLVKSAEDRIKEMLPLRLYVVNHTTKQVLSPDTLGIAGTIRDWCKIGWAGIFPFLLRKSVGDGGGDGMSEDSVAGMWAMHSIELRPGCPAGYEDIAGLVGPRYNQYIEIPEYRFPMAKDFKGKRVAEEGDTCPPTIILDASVGPEALKGAIAEGVAREGVKR